MGLLKSGIMVCKVFCNLYLEFFENFGNYKKNWFYDEKVAFW